jgi:predicted O-methyltransferase YrrM
MLAAGSFQLGDVWAAVGADEWSEVCAEAKAITRRRQGYPSLGGTLNAGDRRAIYSLVRFFGPSSALEIGTHLGSSALHIALALRRNGGDGTLLTLDKKDVNADEGPWAMVGAENSPQMMMEAIGMADAVRFEIGDSLEFLGSSAGRYDFCFLDGSHAAKWVYGEVQLLQRHLIGDAVILLHDYFPAGQRLWPGRRAHRGPFLAIERLKGEGAPLSVTPLGELPWPTKDGQRRSSLAILHRR